MKLNYFGIVGAVLAFVSIALPWWTVSVSAGIAGGTGNWYLYNAGTYGTGLNLWYDWLALLLVILGGITGLAGSIIPNVKKMLIGGGILALLSIIIFAVGLQNDLSSHTSPLGVSLNIFSSSSFSIYGFSYSYSTYLSFGFWLALIAAIIMLVAMRYPKPTPEAPSAPPSQPPPPPPSTPGT
jgi:hypothetical protein